MTQPGQIGVAQSLLDTAAKLLAVGDVAGAKPLIEKAHAMLAAHNSQRVS